jgi:hypothetical protein
LNALAQALAKARKSGLLPIYPVGFPQGFPDARAQIGDVPPPCCRKIVKRKIASRLRKL